MFERCLYFNTVTLARRLNRIWDEAFAPTGLSPSHAYLLMMVLKEPGVTAKVLARELELDVSTVTRFVDALVNKGMVARRKALADKRESNIYPESSARKLEKQLRNTGAGLYDMMCKNLGKENVMDVVSQLRAFNDELGKGKGR